MDQTGVFEIYKTTTQVMRQVVLQKPIQWCGESSSPISLIGDYNTGNQVITVDALIETTGSAIIGLRVHQGGCGNSYSNGYFFSISNTGSWNLYAGTTVLASGTTTFSANHWYTLSLSANDTKICPSVEGKQLTCATNSNYKSGFASIGSTFNYVQYDNFKLHATPVTCGSGDYIKIDECDASLTNQQWMLQSDNTIRLKSDTTKCLTVSGKDPSSGSPAVRLLPCTSPQQPDIVWKVNGNLITNANGECLDITNQDTSQCANVEVYACNGGSNQSWQYSPDSGLIKTLSAGSMCLAATS